MTTDPDDALTSEDYAALVEVAKGPASTTGAGNREKKLTRLGLITKVRLENILTDEGARVLTAWQQLGR